MPSPSSSPSSSSSSSVDVVLRCTLKLGSGLRLVVVVVLVEINELVILCKLCTEHGCELILVLTPLPLVVEVFLLHYLCLAEHWLLHDEREARRLERGSDPRH